MLDAAGICAHHVCQFFCADVKAYSVADAVYGCRPDDDVDWFEPARLRCRPNSVLRIAGLTPQDRTRSPVASDVANCDALRAVETQLKSSCEGRPSCVVDVSAVKMIQSSCRHVRYIDVAVFCEPGTAKTSHRQLY